MDRGDGHVDQDASRALASEVRRRTATHDVTESGEIVRLWAGVKHGLLFAAAYAGLVN